jgi:two-component system nitrogen regulation sensor histidine kinase GlnL
MKVNNTTTQVLIDNMCTSVLLLDNRLRIVYMNPAAEMLLGHSLRQCLGNPLQQFVPGPDEFIEQVQKALDDRHPYTAREQELVFVARQEESLADLTVTPISTSYQQEQLMIEISCIDRRARLLRDENHLSQHQATRQLIRGMAHEIKNPLGGLRGAAQLLDKELDTEELKEYTQIIIEEADRLQSLVDKLLGPRGVPTKEMISIHEVLEHVRQLIKVEAGDQVEAITNYDPSLPEICGDRDLLVQVFLNIARNALLALEGQDDAQIMFKTRIKRQFTIGPTKHKLVLIAQVIDNGPGIPDELQETIFFPMVTGNASGTGLGLSIAQSLVSQHDGIIEFESQPGKTAFTVCLPVTETRNES